MRWAEGYYVKNGKPTKTFSNSRESLSHVVRWYGQSPVSDFRPDDLGDEPIYASMLSGDGNTEITAFFVPADERPACGFVDTALQQTFAKEV